MDHVALQTELTVDPLTRGYAALSHEDAALDLNTVYRTRNRTSMTGSEIWENTDNTEFAALTDAKKSQWISFCGIASVDPFGPASAFVIYIFGGGSATVTTLASARVETVSRAVELLGAEVLVGDIEYARSL